VENPAFREVKTSKTAVRNFSRAFKFGKCAI